MDPEALMRMMQMGDQQGAPRERGSGRPRGAAPNGGAAGATPDVGALLSSLGPDGMPDLDKIARASGMDPETMRGHAQRLWKHMDELAEKSPDEYRSFLEKQAANAGVDPNSAFGPAGRAGGTGADPKDIAAAAEARRAAAAAAAAATARREGGVGEHMSPSLLTKVAGLSSSSHSPSLTRDEPHAGPTPLTPPPLIEEVDGSPGVHARTHEVRVTRGAGGVPVAVEVTCDAPVGVTSAAGVAATVRGTPPRYVHVEWSSGDVGGKTKTCVALPVPVDPDDVSAVFRKKERRLTLRLAPASSE